MSDSSSYPDEGEAPSIELTPFFQANYTTNGHSGYRLYVLAANAVGMPDEIFRYYQRTPDAITGDVVAEPSGVCTWPDLEAYPANTPREDDSPQVFRLSYIDVILDNESQAQEVWLLLQAAVTQLVAVIRDGQILEQGSTVTIT